MSGMSIDNLLPGISGAKKTERSRRYRFFHSSFVVAIVVYLIFNEGYSAETTGTELSREAIRLGRLLLDLLQLHRIQNPR